MADCDTSASQREISENGEVYRSLSQTRELEQTKKQRSFRGDGDLERDVCVSVRV